MSSLRKHRDPEVVPSLCYRVRLSGRDTGVIQDEEDESEVLNKDDCLILIISLPPTLSIKVLIAPQCVYPHKTRSLTAWVLRSIRFMI